MLADTTIESSYGDPAAFWRTFGFTVVQDGLTLLTYLPRGLIAFTATDSGGIELLWHFAKKSGPLPSLVTAIGESETWFFQLPEHSDIEAIRATVPGGIIMHRVGEVIQLPSGTDFMPETYGAETLVDLRVFNLAMVPTPDKTSIESGAQPLVHGNPLAKYSLQGHLGDLEAAALATKPLLGNVALAGQATIIFAPPNSGKTLLTIWLLIEAIRAGRIHGGNVYYMNADDSSSGVADKMRLLEDVGAHMLVPGHKGFSAKKLITLMQEMVTTNKCRGVVIVVDTLKKVVDTMDKKDSTAFGAAVRECVARGATFVGLGHTRKNPSASGNLVHGGTTDLLEDADAACILTPLTARTADGDKVVVFQSIKRRGDNVDEAFAYADGGTASYDELMASVRRVDPDHLDRFLVEAEERTDEPVIEIVKACISDGVVQKMLLADAVAKRARISSRAAIKIIERYQGDDPEKHPWTYVIGERGAKLYRLLPK